MFQTTNGNFELGSDEKGHVLDAGEESLHHIGKAKACTTRSGSVQNETD